MTTSWLHFLQAHSIPDELRAQAYEDSTAQERQLLKTAIAYHSLAGQSPSIESTVTAYNNQGFWQRKHSAPTPLAFILCGEEFHSPARLVAAAMPALLAGVAQSIFLQVGPPQPQILLALELLGLEEAYALPCADSALEFLRLLGSCDDLNLHTQNTRLLLLHPQLSLAALSPAAKNLRIPCYEETQAPRIFLAPTLSDSTREYIAFAHPDAEHASGPFAQAQAYYGVDRPSQNVLAQAVSQGSALYQQHFTRGMEGCWHMTGLDKSFFLNHCVMAGLCDTKENPEDTHER